MSKTYVLRFDTGNAAFEDYGRDAEVASVISRAADRIERDGVDDGFKVHDTNGNHVGTFGDTTSPVEPAKPGEVLLSIETGNAAFEDGETGEIVRILRHAAKRIEQGDWPTGLLDFNGNTVGVIADNKVEPEIELPEDVVKHTLKHIYSKADGVEFYADPARREALARDLDLATFAESWRLVGVVVDEDGDPSDVWVSQDADPSEGKSFVQVMRNGMVEDWAEDFEAQLNGDPAPRGYR